jgi:carbon storage regulator
MVDESIQINDDITICVVEIRDDKVKLGIEAPGKDAVHRQEVYRAIKRAGGDIHRPKERAKQRTQPQAGAE